MFVGQKRLKACVSLPPSLIPLNKLSQTVHLFNVADICCVTDKDSFLVAEGI